MPSRTSRASSACAASLALVVVAGCGGARPGWQGAVTDSAGIQFVANPAKGLWGSRSPWHFEQALRIGSGAGSTATPGEGAFGSVVGLDLDSAGDVYVADGKAQHVQVFSPDGRFLRTIGAPGDGPGEIGRNMGGVLVRGHEIWVPDLRNARIDRFSLDGRPLPSEPLDLTGGVPSQWAHLSDGRLVAQLMLLPTPGTPDDEQGSPLVSFADEVRDTILVLPKGGGVHVSGGRARARLFEPQAHWDAAPDGRILTAMSGAYRVEVRGAAGRLVRVITRPFTAPKVTPSDESRIRDALRKEMSGMGLPPEGVDEAMSGLTFADAYPVLQRVLAGPDSTVWVQRVRTAKQITNASGSIDLNDLGSDDWDVFDRDGRYLGVLAFPHRFSPIVVRGKAFLGVQRDSVDVPSVVEYRLVQGSAAGS